MHRYYAQLRSRLFPYLYSTAHIASKTGWPVLQPLTLAYPNDKKNREILHQYLLGPALMVGIYKKDIYFPAGEWKDYWTGEMIEGGLQKNINWPEDRGGALYVKEGAIIPMGPMMQYRGEKPMDEMTLYIFPAEKKTSFDLYEDDGVSFEYEKGKFTSTNISAQKVDGVATVQIGAPSGGFEQSVKQRSWQLILHFSGIPSAVAVNGTPLGKGEYSYDAVRKELTIYKIAGPVTVSAKAE